MSADNPFADLIARPQVGGISADNPFADLIAKPEPTSAEPATNDFPASGGLTIAPKGARR